MYANLFFLKYYIVYASVLLSKFRNCDSGQQLTAGGIGLLWSRINSRLDDH